MYLIITGYLEEIGKADLLNDLEVTYYTTLGI